MSYSEEETPRPVDPGFVRMWHPVTGGVGDVPESSYGRHRALGWLNEGEPDPEPEPALDDPPGTPDDDSDDDVDDED